MTTYKLPEWLGGGTYEAVGIHHDDHGESMIRLDIPGVGTRRLPSDLLTEVKPPLPPEPPNRTHMGCNGYVFTRRDETATSRNVLKRERCWFDGSGDGRTWAEVVEYSETHSAPLVRLVPDLADDAPALPWRLKDHAGNTVARVERSDANKDRLFVDLCCAHLESDQVRELAAVLWAWAAREVEQP